MCPLAKSVCCTNMPMVWHVPGWVVFHGCALRSVNVIVAKNNSIKNNSTGYDTCRLTIFFTPPPPDTRALLQNDSSESPLPCNRKTTGTACVQGTREDAGAALGHDGSGGAASAGRRSSQAARHSSRGRFGLVARIRRRVLCVRRTLRCIWLSRFDAASWLSGVAI